MTKYPTTHQIKAFQKNVYTQAEKAARVYPWRAPSLKVRKDGSVDPYKILVSEIMLQQTQTARVVDYFTKFITAFPNIHTLAGAPLSDVLRLWQGLGYNRRAKMLHACARVVVSDHRGRLPRERTVLLTLPGIGPYTAGAIRAFAYNEPDVFIETNIRTVYYHHFFQESDTVHDNELLPLIEQTLDRDNPRLWYSALMDYGAQLKQRGVRLNAKHTGYTRQSTFEGSNRQIRGAIVRLLSEEHSVTGVAMRKKLSFDPEKIMKQLFALSHEGFIEKRGRTWRLKR